MERQLFLHHYLPAFYFGILLAAVIFDIITVRLTEKVKFIMVAVIGAFSAATFVHYSPLIYGLGWTKNDCEASKLVSTWDYNCNNYNRVNTPKASGTPLEDGAKPANVAHLDEDDERWRVPGDAKPQVETVVSK